MKTDPEIGDNVKCSECGKEFVLQIDSACFDDEYCRCPDCADEWEKDVEEGIIFSYIEINLPNV
jgi:uncharacterized OB-fold protein